MRRSKYWWMISVLGIALLAVPSCTDSDLDDGGEADVIMQVLEVSNPEVEAVLADQGLCSVTGAICLDSSDCDPDNPADDCIINVQDCTIKEWTATIANTPKTDLANSSPFQDIVLESLTITYQWNNGFDMDPNLSTIGGTIFAGGVKGVTFFPITAEDLAELSDFDLLDGSKTASVILEFRGEVEDGNSIKVTTGSQLFVECP